MAQSKTLLEFFSPDGELDRTFREEFPVALGPRKLWFFGFVLQGDEASGEDSLVGTFRLITYDSSGTKFENVLEEAVWLLDLPPAVADDVYEIQGIRVCIGADVVKGRLLRFVRALKREVLANYERLGASAEAIPSQLFLEMR
jgi:hypothetical protein